jgi:hypothetical protein
MKDSGISNDALWIETLPLIGGDTPDIIPEIQNNLTIDKPETVEIELLNKLPEYSRCHPRSSIWQFPFAWSNRDDAIISYAKLKLTREDEERVGPAT